MGILYNAVRKELRHKIVPEKSDTIPGNEQLLPRAMVRGRQEQAKPY